MMEALLCRVGGTAEMSINRNNCDPLNTTFSAETRECK